LELDRLEEDIQRAHSSYRNKVLAPEMASNERESLRIDAYGDRSQTFIPENEREQHTHL